MEKHQNYDLDEHRKLAIPGNEEETLQFCATNWLKIASEAIKDHGFFSVALSGGSTPKKIYQKIAAKENQKALDWEKVYLFWSDERSAGPESVDSNYYSAMQELSKLNIPSANIYRMIAEKDPEQNAIAYESTIKQTLSGRPFDLIMLGMGDDGHTASLFPQSKALHEDQRLVTAHYVQQKKSWRTTFSYPLINSARNIHVYVLGQSKAEIVEKVLTAPYNPNEYPIQKVGTKDHPALWILDEAASRLLINHL